MADPNSELIDAVMAEDLLGMREALARGADPDLEGDPSMPPLHVAAIKGNCAAIELLLQAGAKIDRRDKDGNSPLIFAALWGRKNALRQLLGAGADMAAECLSGDTALSSALANGKPGCLRILLEAGSRDWGAKAKAVNGYPAMTRAARWPNEMTAKELLMALLDAGESLEGRDGDIGWTPLMWAAAYDAKEPAFALLDRGADPEAKDQEGRTAEGIARMSGHEDLARGIRDKAMSIEEKRRLETESRAAASRQRRQSI